MPLLTRLGEVVEQDRYWKEVVKELVGVEI